MTRPEAVVFDCDGVLVDSEPHSIAAWLEVLSALGHPGTSDDIEACTGLGFVPTRESLVRLAPLPPPDELWPRLLEALAGSFRSGLVVFPDATAVLVACEEAGVPVAVASASPRARLDLTLQTAGLAPRFAISVAGDEVAYGKPAPDVYLAAADRLGVAPAGCVAIEDSPVGVRAAVVAGMRVLGTPRPGTGRGVLVAAGAEVPTRLDPEILGL